MGRVIPAHPLPLALLNLDLQPTLTVPVIEALGENLFQGFLEPVRAPSSDHVVAVLLGPSRTRAVLLVIAVHIQLKRNRSLHGVLPRLVKEPANTWPNGANTTTEPPPLDGIRGRMPFNFKSLRGGRGKIRGFAQGQYPFANYVRISKEVIPASCR